MLNTHRRGMIIDGLSAALSVHAGRLGAAAIAYLLRATFDAGDQGYSNGQVLNTVAEGVQDGQLTVVEVDGTLAIVSNECAFTTPGTPAWTEQGFYSQAITRTLGYTLLNTATVDATNKYKRVQTWNDGAGLAQTDLIYLIELSVSANILVRVFNGLGAIQRDVLVGSYAASTAYQWALVLGGYDANGVPWRSGEAAGSYDYGATWFVKGGAFTNWTLLWRTLLQNTATLYATFSNYNGSGTLDNFRVPDADLSAVLQPLALSTFTAANGTALSGYTPEVGGTWTVVDATGDDQIQSNKLTNQDAVALQNILAVVDTGEAQGMNRVALTASQWVKNMLNVQDATHYWAAILVPNDNQMRLEEWNGGLTTRGTANVTINSGQEYDTVLIREDANTVTAFLDGANRITYGSATNFNTVTQHGVYLDNSVGGVTAKADNHHFHARTSSDYDDEFDLY